MTVRVKASEKIKIADLRNWQTREIRSGVKEANAGKFTDPKKVDAFFKKWKAG